MALALTRGVSPKLASCELEFLDRQPIDSVKAAEQHRAYERCLESLGLRVISLPAEADLPDCVFIEDPAIVLDEVAVICRTGAASRRREADGVAVALAPYRELKHVAAPATIEGGDVMRVGKTLYVGISRRTNRDGIRQLAELVAPFGYRVCAVQVVGSLHLKSACCWLGDQLLANPAWIGPIDLPAIEVPEAAAANVLRVEDTVLMPSSFPRTRELLDRLGYSTMTVDISELQKAEGGVTCSSLIFREPRPLGRG